MTRFPLIVLAAALMCGSCADGNRSGSRQDDTLQSFSRRVNEDYGYTQDKQGNWVPKSDKRSSFENKGDSPYFNNQFSGKSFDTSNYGKSSWWGRESIHKKAYEGGSANSNFSQSSSYGGRQAAGLDGVIDGRQLHGGERHSTRPASENKAQRIDRESDAETDVRRRVFPQPDVIDYQEQRRLSLDQSKSLLGR